MHMILLDAISEQCAGGMPTPFVYKLTNFIQMKECCDARKERFEPTTAIPLHIKHMRQKLEDVFRDAIQPERIEDYQCNECGVRTEALMGKEIVDPGLVMTVDIERSSYDWELGIRQRISA
eukprot:SAG11_NODE_5384_length_1576_cov_1.643873_1_plen_120_part_10